MKSYTDLPQSKKLAEILPLESADMFYDQYGVIRIGNPKERYSDYHQLPVWSLAALMDVLDRGALFKTPQGWACQSYMDFKAITSDYHSNPIDACYEMIVKPYEQKLL